MDLVFFFLISLLNLFILIAHFSLGLNNPLTDLLSSIPNLFIALTYLVFGFLLTFFKNTHINLIKIELFLLFIVYIISYIWYPFNVILITQQPNSFITSSHATICDQNTKKSSVIQNQEFWQLIKMNKCDIIVLQEVQNSDYQTKIIRQQLKKITRTDYKIINYGEFIIASRYPITIETTSTSAGFISALINIPTQRIRIINVHIWTPLEPKTPENDPFVTYPIPPFIVRKQQTTELLSYLMIHQYDSIPNIVIGDFNMLPTHNFISTKLKRLNYHRIKTSRFLTPTFSTSIPIIEIDHLFTNIPSIIRKRTTLLGSPSDHAMQIIQLNLQK